jgi:drug/metabolite transporter (DMT)-like permease
VPLRSRVEAPQPLSGLGLAILVLGDRPTPGFVLGCALVLAGVYVAVGRTTPA